EQAFTAPLFVIQNPVAASAIEASAQTGLNLGSACWLGLFTAVVGIVALFALIRPVIHFIRLRLFLQSVKVEGYSMLRIQRDVTVLFSKQVEIPCTFGWLEKHIILPADLRNEPVNYRMALRHELTHIKNY